MLVLPLPSALAAAGNGMSISSGRSDTHVTVLGARELGVSGVIGSPSIGSSSSLLSSRVSETPPGPGNNSSTLSSSTIRTLLALESPASTRLARYSFCRFFSLSNFLASPGSEPINSAILVRHDMLCPRAGWELSPNIKARH